MGSHGRLVFRSTLNLIHMEKTDIYTFIRLPVNKTYKNATSTIELSSEQMLFVNLIPQ